LVDDLIPFLGSVPSRSSNPFDGLGNALNPSLPRKVNPFARYAPAGMLGAKPPGTLLGTGSSAAVANALAPCAAPILRKVYFAFAFHDVIRVNNVRNNGKIGPRVSHNPRMFSDRSIWERRDIKNEENLKNLMRNGMRYSSVVCVMIGTKTWNSRWAKYEVARSVVDKKGLFAVISTVSIPVTGSRQILQD
jgi:hypothetical protein